MDLIFNTVFDNSYVCTTTPTQHELFHSRNFCELNLDSEL